MFLQNSGYLVFQHPFSTSQTTVLISAFALFPNYTDSLLLNSPNIITLYIAGTVPSVRHLPLEITA